jgi:two-component system OmpR family sensor kinase/two-component system sensor histidine kinase BaeS
MASGDLGVRVQSCAIRELNELADAFNSMASSLAQLDLQRRQMTADVAHELRTPLSIIRGRLEGIQDGVYPATPDQIATLLSETAILERLIEDLRLLALADAGQMPLYIDSFPAGQLLASVAHSFAHEAEAQGVTLQVLVQPAMPEVQADPQRLAQVLGNLVSNSLRHTPSGGTITLEAWTDMTGIWPQVRMAVTDTGTGIRPEDLPLVFDRFWKADRARSRGSGGAGLGLAIAKRIVEAHGGHIWAAGGPQSGTTVAFTIPQIAAIPAPVPQAVVQAS